MARSTRTNCYRHGLQVVRETPKEFVHTARVVGRTLRDSFLQARRPRSRQKGCRMAPAPRRDPAGNVLIKPVTGWVVAASETNGVVFMALEYVDSPEQLETGQREQSAGDNF